MSVHVLLSAASSGAGPIVAVNRVTPLTIVYEFSADFTPSSGNDPVVLVTELEKATDTGDFTNVTNPIDELNHNEVPAGEKRIHHLDSKDYLFVQAGFVNPPATGTITATLYLPDGR